MVPAGQRPDDEARTTPAASPPPDAPPRADALRRIAAEVSGRHDLDGLFRDVIDEAFALFGVDQAGLVDLRRRDGRHRSGSSPNAACRPTSSRSSRPCRATHRRRGWRPSPGRSSGSSTGTSSRPCRKSGRSIAGPASGPSASCPSCSGNRPLGLLVLYHAARLRLDTRRDGIWRGPSRTRWRPRSATPAWPTRRAP